MYAIVTLAIWLIRLIVASWWWWWWSWPWSDYPNFNWAGIKTGRGEVGVVLVVVVFIIVLVLVSTCLAVPTGSLLCWPCCLVLYSCLLSPFCFRPFFEGLLRLLHINNNASGLCEARRLYNNNVFLLRFNLFKSFLNDLSDL